MSVFDISQLPSGWCEVCVSRAVFFLEGPHLTRGGAMSVRERVRAMESCLPPTQVPVSQSHTKFLLRALLALSSVLTVPTNRQTDKY